MFFALPRDPVTGMCPKNCNPERLERVRQELGLRDPLISQYAGYMKGIFTGRTWAAPRAAGATPLLGCRTCRTRRSRTPSPGCCR
ncbi:hypothetical protein QTS76_02975, partial [Micromonospora sp. b486]|nr:hypothetical protein [Micromonospora sp. b486]